MSEIAPEKNYADDVHDAQRARSLVVHEQQLEADGWRRNPLRPGGAVGMTTQFVVGATRDTDRTIVERVSELYAGGGVHHVHFSAFRPIRDTPLENARRRAGAARAPAVSDRLSPALLRLQTRDLVYADDGNLPLDRDPKVAWALAHPEHFPVDVATASYGQLVRVPGVGVLTARRIVAERTRRSFEISQICEARRPDHARDGLPCVARPEARRGPVVGAAWVLGRGRGSRRVQAGVRRQSRHVPLRCQLLPASVYRLALGCGFSDAAFGLAVSGRLGCQPEGPLG